MSLYVFVTWPPLVIRSLAVLNEVCINSKDLVSLDKVFKNISCNSWGFFPLVWKPVVAFILASELNCPLVVQETISLTGLFLSKAF